jgi:hypothetical protein
VTWFLSIVIALIEWLFSAWMLMLIVGIVHAEWLPQLPTIGFGLACLLGLFSPAALTVRAVLASINTALVGE